MSLRAITPQTTLGCWACGTGAMPMSEAIEHFESDFHRATIIGLSLQASEADQRRLENHREATR